MQTYRLSYQLHPEKGFSGTFSPAPIWASFSLCLICTYYFGISLHFILTPDFSISSLPSCMCVCMCVCICGYVCVWLFNLFSRGHFWDVGKVNFLRHHMSCLKMSSFYPHPQLINRKFVHRIPGWKSYSSDSPRCSSTVS